MHYDALTAAAVAEEWRRLLVGGRIDRIFQPDAWSLALLLRSQGQNHQVLLSLDPRVARAHLVTGRKLASGFDEPTPFVMLLRKHLESVRLQAVEPPPMERILHLQAAHSGDAAVTLVVELLGRQSNAVLVDAAGIVLGALRYVTSQMSRTRVVLPHRLYAPPPPAVGAGSDRLDPRAVGGTELAAALADIPGRTLAERLPRAVALSPTAAREAVFRATGATDAEQADAEALAAALRDLCKPLAAGGWAPSLAGRGGAAVAFAPYPLTHLAAGATVEAEASISRAVEAYFAPKEASERLEAQRLRLRGLVRAPLERAERRLAAIEEQLGQARRHLGARREGELLLAYQPELAAGQRAVVLEDYESGAPVAIAVDPARSAVANAQERFRVYNRAKRGIEALEPQQAALAIDAAFAHQVLGDVALCDTPPELARLEAELRGAGYFAERDMQAARRPKGKGPRKGERRPAAAVEPASMRLGGFEVLYGKTSLINDALTFRLAGRQDLWLHARNVPGAHVVIRSGGRPVPEEVLARAAAVAAYLSEARGEARAAVDYTTIGNVRRQPGGKPGLVYYVGERTLQVAPLAPQAAASEEVAHAG